MDWETFKEKIHTGVVNVTFTKVDGSLRTMVCTLAPYLLPETGGSGRKPSPETMVVFDLEAEAWRSFRKASVVDMWED